MEVREISLNQLRISEFNSRKDLDAGTEDASLDDLANSIREKGLLSPIIVRSSADGFFDVIAGQRRVLSCRNIGMETISAIIRDDLDDTNATIISLVENVHRADLNPIDKAAAYQTIYAKYGDHKRVAKETGVTVPTVKRYLSLLGLTPSLQARLTTAEGPAGVGALSKLAEMFSPELQERAFDEIDGFKQSVQFEILKGSDGDLDELSALREQALEGAFDVKMCREGLCFVMPEELKVRLKTLLADGSDSMSLDEIVERLT